MNIAWFIFRMPLRTETIRGWSLQKAVQEEAAENEDETG